MEQAEACQAEAQVASRSVQETSATAEKHVGDLNSRESNLQKELERLSVDRDQLAAAVEEGVLLRYERLRKGKGDRVVVGIDHSACGGCHMRLPAQIIVSCQSDAEIVTCPNCARMLFFTREMDLAPAE
jgi:predicted  nucleic acid-binding Zn-ribbon protein